MKEIRKDQFYKNENTNHFEIGYAKMLIELAHVDFFAFSNKLQDNDFLSRIMTCQSTAEKKRMIVF